MTEVFADTFYWLALLNPADAFHEAASSLTVEGALVTSVAVQLEVLDALSTQPALRPLSAPFWQRTTHAADIIVIRLSQDLLEAAIELLSARPDKLWSMTDCISFEIMRHRNITTALTADRHFIQAGFQTSFRAPGP